MDLVIVLRKEVADRDEGLQIIEQVKQKLADRPEITVAGHMTEHIETETPPEPPE